MSQNGQAAVQQTGKVPAPDKVELLERIFKEYLEHQQPELSKRDVIFLSRYTGMKNEQLKGWFQIRKSFEKEPLGVFPKLEKDIERQLEDGYAYDKAEFSRKGISNSLEHYNVHYSDFIRWYNNKEYETKKENYIGMKREEARNKFAAKYQFFNHLTVEQYQPILNLLYQNRMPLVLEIWFLSGDYNGYYLTNDEIKKFIVQEKEKDVQYEEDFHHSNRKYIRPKQREELMKSINEKDLQSYLIDTKDVLLSTQLLSFFYENHHEKNSVRSISRNGPIQVDPQIRQSSATSPIPPQVQDIPGPSHIPPQPPQIRQPSATCQTPQQAQGIPDPSHISPQPAFNRETTSGENNNQIVVVRHEEPRPVSRCDQASPVTESPRLVPEQNVAVNSVSRSPDPVVEPSQNTEHSSVPETQKEIYPIVEQQDEQYLEVQFRKNQKLSIQRAMEIAIGTKLDGFQVRRWFINKSYEIEKQMSNMDIEFEARKMSLIDDEQKSALLREFENGNGIEDFLNSTKHLKLSTPVIVHWFKTAVETRSIATRSVSESNSDDLRQSHSSSRSVSRNEHRPIRHVIRNRVPNLRSSRPIIIKTEPIDNDETEHEQDHVPVQMNKDRRHTNTCEEEKRRVSNRIVQQQSQQNNQNQNPVKKTPILKTIKRELVDEEETHGQTPKKRRLDC